MKVSNIQITWAPGHPKTQAGWVGKGLATEEIFFSGALLKKGVKVAYLTETMAVPAQQYEDGVLIGPTSFTTIWEIEPVEADILELHAVPGVGSGGYPHTIYSNGQKIGLIFEKVWGKPSDYSFKLPVSIADILPQTPDKGPPLPCFLKIYWPWYKGG